MCHTELVVTPAGTNETWQAQNEAHNDDTVWMVESIWQVFQLFTDRGRRMIPQKLCK